MLNSLIKFFRKLLWITGSGLLFAMIITIAAYFYVAPSLPSVNKIRQIQIQTPLRVYSKDAKLIASFGDKRRIPVTLEQIPQEMINAFLAAEDDRFYEHPGVDYLGLIRATINLILTGERTQGGSTITMQLARNFFLTKQRTYERKTKEIFLALMLERLFDKDEILSLYLNKIFLGKRAYGVGAAAEVYYGKTLGELDLSQIATIAGLPKAPSLYNPIASPSKAAVRRNYVLGRMLDLKMIDPLLYQQTLDMPVHASRHGLNIELSAPYVAEMVRAKLHNEYGPDTYTRGFKVYTTLDSKLQNGADVSLREGLLKYDRRHGWRGASLQIDPALSDFAQRVTQTLIQRPTVGGLTPAVVYALDNKALYVVLKGGEKMRISKKGWSWARPYTDENQREERPQTAWDIASTGSLVYVVVKKGVAQLQQIPKVAGALVALNPGTGAVLALSGGFDFNHSKFNRVMQANRQPGSNFKPFIYSAALSKGYTPASIVLDTPVVFANSHLDWRPKNYSGKFFGPTRLRIALQHSRNLVSIKLVDDIGIDETLDFVRRFGFERKNHPRNMTLALGSGTASPLDMASGYAVFANGGSFVESYFIERITSNNEAIYQAQPLSLCVESCSANDDNAASTATASSGYARRAIPADIAYQMTSMLRGVIREGTGRRARSLRRGDVAGKTGTTNDQRDAWFSGYSRDIVASVWVGFDNHTPLGERETGSVAALPIWIDFMRKALAGKPERKYYKPSNIMTAKINRKNGLLAHPADDKGIIETFRSDYLPKDMASPPAPAKNETKDDGLF